MKEVKRWVNEVTGAEFKNAEDARKSEAKSLSIEKIFSFWKEAKNPKGSCEFSNGGWSIQRKREDKEKLTDAIIKAVKLHEPWVASEYDKDGGLRHIHVNSQYMLGRYLSDGSSALWHWLLIHGNVCSVCFREYGQTYYATNCEHEKSTIPVKAL